MHEYDSLPPSSKIIPVFISFQLHSKVISEEILANLRAYQPIGFRHEETIISVRDHGFIANISDCIIAILPKRKVKSKAQKIFLLT